MNVPELKLHFFSFSVDSLRAQGMDESAGYLRSFTGDYGEAVRNAIQVP
jgi:hypothetical protein